MGDAFRVRARERRCKLARGRDDHLNRWPCQPGNLIAERVPLHELGRDVELPIELFEGIDGADTGMGQDRGGARFAAKPIAMARLASQLRRDRLERNGAAEAAVRREIHAPHAAAADLAHDGIGPKDGARLERVLFLEQMRRRFGDRLHEKRTSPRVVFQKGPHFRADDGIIGRRGLEPFHDVGWIVFERGLEQIAGAAPLLRSHAGRSRRDRRPRGSRKGFID